MTEMRVVDDSSSACPMPPRAVLRFLGAVLLAGSMSACGGGGKSDPPAPPAAPPAATPPTAPTATGKACLSAAAAATTSAEQAPALVKNVLFIFTEDQGMQLGVLGTPGLKTPGTDRMAAEGALMTAAHVTLATCTGSKSSIFTGFYNHSSGANGNVDEFVGSQAALDAANPTWLHDSNSAYNRFRIHDNIPTLIEILHNRGFFTGLQNKFHLSPHYKFPYDQWDSTDSSHAQVHDFIVEARRQNKPWFLTHVIQNTHRPYPNSDSAPISVDPSVVKPPAHLPSTAVVAKDWAEYLAAIQIADQRLANVLTALDELDAAKDTLVVFMGDHGPGYHRGKWTTYGLGLRPAMIFRGPGVSRGVVMGQPFSNVDMMPTLLDMLGIPSPATQGTSFRNLLTGATTTSPRDCVVGEALSDRSIFDGRYRLIETPVADDTVMPADNREFDPWRNRVYSHIRNNADTPGFEFSYRLLDMADRTLTRFSRPPVEFYDTQNDPWEIHDLASDPAYATERARLAQRLDQWRADTGDTPR